MMFLLAWGSFIFMVVVVVVYFVVADKWLVAEKKEKDQLAEQERQTAEKKRQTAEQERKRKYGW